MAIEIRQMLIKSNVIQRESDDDSSDHRNDDTESRKAEILAECRRMIIDILNARKER